MSEITVTGYEAAGVSNDYVKRVDYEAAKRLAVAMCLVNGQAPFAIDAGGAFAFELHMEAASNYILADAAMDLIKRGLA